MVIITGTRNDKHTTIKILAYSNSSLARCFEPRHEEYQQQIPDEFTSKKVFFFFLSLLLSSAVYSPASIGESVHQTGSTKRQISRGKDSAYRI